MRPAGDIKASVIAYIKKELMMSGEIIETSSSSDGIREMLSRPSIKQSMRINRITRNNSACDMHSLWQP